MRAVICGANGAMGKLLQLRFEDIAGLVSIDGENGVAKTFTELGDVKPEVVVDFSHHSAAPQATAHCGRAGEGKRTTDEIGISSLRMGSIVGIHEIHICTESQRLTLKHEASDRGMFADGAKAAAEFILGKPAGLYNMESLLENR